MMSRGRGSPAGALLPLLLTLTACSADGSIADIAPGQTRDEVMAVAGEPDGTSRLTLPDGPIFGPQEGLMDLVEPGTEVEEWRFAIGDDVTYVWFGSASGEEPEDWRVLGTATYPAGAVF